MINKGIILTAGAFILCLLHTAAWAEDYKALTIKPGNYVLTTTSSSTLTPDEVVDSRELCMEKDKLDPAGDLLKKERCSISNYKSKGEAISFDFLCNKEDGTRNISGSLAYSSSGDKFAWIKVVKSDFTKEQEFTIKSTGKAVRKGDCS